MQISNQQKRLIEVAFNVFVLNVFDVIKDPVEVMTWLRYTSELLHIDHDMMQRMVLSIMGSTNSLLDLSDELAWLLLSTGQSVHAIVKLGVRSRATIYRRIKQYPTMGKRHQLRFTKEELQLALKFLTTFGKIGGVIP